MNDVREHWLRRPETIRKLWIVGIIVLAVLLVIGELIERHPHFAGENIIGFNAWFGFGSCVVMVVVAKLLGFVLKRKDTYYERD
jgi:hypothetical protein